MPLPVTGSLTHSPSFTFFQLGGKWANYPSHMYTTCVICVSHHQYAPHFTSSSYAIYLTRLQHSTGFHAIRMYRVSLRADVVITTLKRHGELRRRVCIIQYRNKRVLNRILPSRGNEVIFSVEIPRKLSIRCAITNRGKTKCTVKIQDIWIIHKVNREKYQKRIVKKVQGRINGGILKLRMVKFVSICYYGIEL